MRIFQNLNVDFLQKRKYFYILSATLFIVGVINILIRGLGFGIDFLGGTEIALQFNNKIQIAELRSYTNTIGLGEVEIKTFGGDRGALIRTELQEIPQNLFPKVQKNIEDAIERNYPGLPKKIVSTTNNSVTYQFANMDTTNALIQKLYAEGYQTMRAAEDVTNTQMTVRVGISDWIKEKLKDKYANNPFEVQRETKVGPKVGKELKTDAVIAVFFSLVVILVYLAFRFKFIFAVGAVLALFHDVLITLGLYSILYGMIPGLNLDIDLTIVAAFLTLIGYSVSDTVVIFDRVRENLKLHKTLHIRDNINNALNKTMNRTILTGGSTLLSLFVLVLFGGEVLRAFAFTLFFGIIIGTYSSIFVASAIVYDYAEWSKRKIEF